MSVAVIQTGAVRQDFYKDNDLAIGASVNVYGRKFLLCDCDDFTKEYYNAKYGISKLSTTISTCVLSRINTPS
jgi:hypothetical protein